MKIIEYRILTAGSAGGLSVEVNTFIGEGWQPLGAASFGSSLSYGGLFIQVIVRYE